MGVGLAIVMETKIMDARLSWKCRRHVATRVAPILARWVRVADTIFSMSWQFVSARADIY